jgi:hypothetical protein
MFLVDEKMGATAEDDELLLVFWRLVGGAVGEPPVLFAEDIFQTRQAKMNAEVASKSHGKPRNGFLQIEHEEKTRSTFDAWTLDFTVHLHHTTQTRRNTMPKAPDHGLITI